MNTFSAEQYFKILGLSPGATLDQVKKAYRKKARMYHPDLNKREEAADIFIAVNEAYEYLSNCISKGYFNESYQDELKREWERYRREEARRKAYAYSRAKYYEFTKSSTYKTSMVLNKAQLLINLSVSMLVIIAAIIGYIDKWRMVDEGFDPPTLVSLIFLLSIGIIFLLVSVAHIQAFNRNARKQQKNEKNN